MCNMHWNWPACGYVSRRHSGSEFEKNWALTVGRERPRSQALGQALRAAGGVSRPITVAVPSPGDCTGGIERRPNTSAPLRQQSQGQTVGATQRAVGVLPEPRTSGQLERREGANRALVLRLLPRPPPQAEERFQATLTKGER
jgi:hypothetical protein